MNFEPLTPFDEITSSIVFVSPWQAMWNEAEEMLREERPEGFTPEDIGRVAFDSLPESEREEALDCLFYTFWATVMADRERATAKGGERR
ncbi:hypothetical protein ABZZ74_23710 [Streptomyces sp. NPDC006476]|uniref:hypothetical protein n=1 Tax=Streptomyces sp. NPDC006476 TaxID=3157175 RepID=UPI0033BCD10A